MLNDGAAFSLDRPLRYEGCTSDIMLDDVVTTYGAKESSANPGIIKVMIVDSIPGAYDYQLYGYQPEAYSIDVTADTVYVKALNSTGVKRAAATLGQLAMNASYIPALALRDWPAFKLRGFMHDVGRSFISIDELKREIYLLSKFKINTFHWHFTENQAWRFAVDAFPELTADSVTVRFPGKYYTPEECTELERYAAERGVTIIPEVDMPGHSAAFTRAMGHTMQTDEGVQELGMIIESLAKAFPLAPYLHIGGDEVAITYPRFLETMIDKVHSLGRKVILWNPIHGVNLSKLDGYDMTQMWSTAGRRIAGKPNIDCRYNYANHFDTFADIEGIYSSNIYYEPCGSAENAGTISAYWNDRKLPGEKDIIGQNNFYAAVLASAERAWIGGGNEYIERGGVRMVPGSKRHKEFADWERRFLTHKNGLLAAEPVPYMRQSDVVWNVAGPFENGGDATASFWPEQREATPADTAMIEVAGAGVYLRHAWGRNVPGWYGDIRSGHTAYAWTWVYSPNDTVAGAYIELQNYSRSEKDLAPDAGCWDRKGSRIWLNGEEILPPAWFNSGLNVSNESLLLNENASGRPVIPVTLRKGWNKVLFKLPYVDAPGIRLNKWMYTFLLTDMAGRNALDGVTYSTAPTMVD
ncbi:MAG: beta-N-acetylhexosaminidase [Muribaculaceae bacterium]|nr:beta-N-acetylhexosaminidase [Muribaculaceae bacterium]